MCAQPRGVCKSLGRYRLLFSWYLLHGFCTVHTLQGPFLKRSITILVCHPRGTVPDCWAMLQRPVSQDSSTSSRDLRYSGQMPDTLLQRSLLTTSVTSWVIVESISESLAPTSLIRILYESPWGIGNGRLFEVLLPLSDSVSR